MENKFEEFKNEMNIIKKQSSQLNITLNKEDKKKIIKEIKDEINIKELIKNKEIKEIINENIKEIINNKEIKDILYKEFEEKLSSIYYKEERIKENNKNIVEYIEDSINKKFNINNENINKLKEDINKYIQDINEIKNNSLKDINIYKNEVSESKLKFKILKVKQK